MLKQQAIGVIRLSAPIAIFAFYYPAFLATFFGMVVCSLVMGSYISYKHYIAINNLANSLIFIPSGEYKNMLEENIKECKLDPQGVNVRYAYSDEALALTMFNTISVDPLVWQDVAQDPAALKCKDVLNQYTVPHMSEAQKNRISKINEHFSTQVQRFIFKHELGHVFYNYSNKKLAIIFITSALSVYMGISIAVALKSLGMIAVLVGMLVGGLGDLVLTYASNVLFKLYEEKRADRFAAKYSSKEDIDAAADFFEKLHEIRAAHKEQDNVLAKIPSEILQGHLSDKARAQYLRHLS